MSHFLVLVVGDDIEEQMAPFQEELPIEFNDTEDEYRREYETDGTEMVLCPDGELAFPWKVDKTSDYEKVFVPYKEKYETFEKFAEDYHGHEGPDPKTGRYGYWHNPNSKWDWYDIGGRWAGQLVLTKEAHMRNPEDEDYGSPNFSWGWDEDAKTAVLSEPRVDSAIKRDVDIDAMERPIRERAEKRWSEWHSEVKMLEDKEQQPWIHENLGFLVTQKDIDLLNEMSKEEYVACKSIWATYAFVWNKKWYAKGEMHMFAISTDEESSWSGQFKELWNELPDDVRVTVVDCHI